MADRDLRLWSRELIIEFIELYKSHQCLWDVKCDGYKNKYVKSFAYKDLVQFCKKRGFPEANRDFVARKIQGLRGSFRKEARKTRIYKRAGKSYKSNLWYYNNLLFTKEGHADDDEEQNQTDDDARSDNCDDDVDEESKFSADENFGEKAVTEFADVLSSSPPPKIRKRHESAYMVPISQPEFLDIGQDRTKDLKELSEFELTGMNVAKKLARMSETQAIYAESLINSVIRKGLLNKLKEQTDLCDNLCGRSGLSRTNDPSQSFSSN